MSIENIEFVNKLESEYVCSLTKDEFFELFPRTIKNIKGSMQKVVNNNEYYRMVIQYLKKHKITSYQGLTITYSPSQLNPTGRVFVKDPIGLQRIHNELRYFLTRGLYHDYDMKNAHPSILCNICEHHDLTTTHQRNYLRDRSRLLCDANVEKSTMLIKLNSDNAKFSCTKSKELNALVHEWNVCKKQLFDFYKDKIGYKKDKNPISSLVNSLICQKENELLNNVLPNTNKLVLMFDGFMSLETIDYKNFPNDIVEWDDKPIVSNIVVPDDFEIKESLYEDYNTQKESFEKSHAKIINNSCFIIVNDETKVITYKTKTDMLTSYEHLKCMKTFGSCIKETSFIKEWLCDPEMRRYKTMDCYPDDSKCPYDVFNTWTPFRVALMDECEIDNVAVEMFIKHVEILCNNNIEVSKIIIKWVAHMFLHPDKKSFFPTFITEQGSGKGTFIELLSSLMGGKKILETQKPLVDVFGNHNALMVNAYLVFFDEVNKSDMNAVQGQLKGVISEGTMTINPKGKDQFIINSPHKFCATSNGKDPMPTEHGDRRNYIIKGSDELKANLPYFKEFRERVIDSDIGVYSVYKYLLNLEDVPETFNVLQFPKTEYQEILKDANRDYIDTWLEDLTQRHTHEVEISMTSKEIYDDWKLYVNNNGITINYSSLQFQKRLALLCIDGVSIKKTKFCNMKCFDINKLKNKYMVGCQVDVVDINDNEGHKVVDNDKDNDDDESIIFDNEND